MSDPSPLAVALAMSISLSLRDMNATCERDDPFLIATIIDAREETK